MDLLDLCLEIISRDRRSFRDCFQIIAMKMVSFKFYNMKFGSILSFIYQFLLRGFC